MDNPVLDDPATANDEAGEAKETMKVALSGKNTSGLPDHMYISREYIKEMLFEAAKLAHPDLGNPGTASGEVAAASADTRSKLPPGPGIVTPGGASTQPVADETSLEAQEHSGVPGGGGLSMAPAAYEKIGRAMHALQDFWSHSNFVERAIGVPEFDLGGLTTATFGADDKTHALAHKVRGAADEIDARCRSWTACRGAGAPTRPRARSTSATSRRSTTRTTRRTSSTRSARPATWPRRCRATCGAAPSGAGTGRRAAAGAAPSAGSAAPPRVRPSPPRPASWAARRGSPPCATSPSGLDEKTEAKQKLAGDSQAHGLLAKDQPGHDDTAFGLLKTARFELAHELSVAADEMVAGRMKEVVDASDATLADALLMDIFDTLDQLIGDAGPGHPLWGIVEAHRKTAEEALNAYLAEKETTGAAAPAH